MLENDSDSSDLKHLRRWVQERSERDFRLLVGRHAAFVHRVARNVCQEDALASDACQLTFITLANKSASLLSRDSIVGWLHTTTVMHSKNLIRARERHTRKSKELPNHMDIHHTSSKSSSVAELPPQIDEELHRLAEKDREIILLRFYGSLSMSELGDKLGIKKDAAQKRLDRALARLRSRLARRNIKVTGSLSAALAASFSAPPAQAMPAVSFLVSKAIASSVASPSTLFMITTAITTMTNKTVLTTTAIVLLLGTAGYLAVKAGSQSDSTPISASSPSTTASSRNTSEEFKKAKTKTSQRTQETNEELAALYEKYGKERTRLARKITADTMLFLDEILVNDEIVQKQREAPNATQHVKWDGMEKFSSGGTEFRGPMQFTEEQHAAFKEAYKPFKERRRAEQLARNEELKKKPTSVAELYLASDARARGEISREEYERIAEDLGLANSGLTSPGSAVEYANNALSDPAYVEEVRSVLNEDELEIFNNELASFNLYNQAYSSIGLQEQTLETTSNLIETRRRNLRAERIQAGAEE